MSPRLFLSPPITRKRDTLHRYWDLSLFLLTEKMKTAILALKGALKSKSVDQGSFKVKTVKQKYSNTWKEVKTFNSKILFKRERDYPWPTFSSPGQCAPPEIEVVFRYCSISISYFQNLSISPVFHVSLSLFFIFGVEMYELWSGIPTGLGTPIKNIGASLSVKSAEVGEPKKCAQNQADAMNSFASYPYLWHIAY